MSIAKKILLNVKKLLTCTQQFLKKFAMGDRLELYMYRFAFKDKYTIGDIWLGRNGRKVCDTIEDKVRDLNHNGVFDNGEVKIPSETAIPCGRYRINMHTQSPYFKQKAFYNNLCKGYLPRLMDVPLFDGILIHCLTPETEILTEHGWQNYEKFKANPAVSCFSFNTETHKIELSKINFMVEEDYEGKLYYNEGKRFNYAVTDKHRMFCNVKKRDGSREWQWRTADDIPYGSQFLTSGIKSNGWDLSKEQKLLYRLIMATQADGYILNWSNTASQVRFHLKKERKIERLKSLLDSLGEQYKTFVDCEGKTHFTLSPQLSEYLTESLNPYRLISCGKTLPKELLCLKSEDIKDMLLEYLFWDGRYENYLKNNLNMVICTTVKSTADLLQAMASLCGMRSNVKLERPKTNCHSNLWNVVLYDGQDVCQSESSQYGTRDYKGKVWCLNNDNHSIIIRLNGRTMIVGNCGNTAQDSAGCIIVGDNKQVGQVIDSQKRFVELYSILKRADDEKVPIYINIIDAKNGEHITRKAQSNDEPCKWDKHED